ncbi:MAG: DUF1570 domain-containing protein [Planctomycetota bacterium]
MRYYTLLFLLIILLVIAASSVSLAETIYMKNGRKIEGQVIKETMDKLIVKTKFGEVELDKMEIDRIDREKSPVELYEEKAKKCGTADEHYKLAVWCKENSLEREMNKEFEKVIELSPDHENARKELGYQKHEGKWLTEDEIMESKGLIKWQGTWIPEEEYQNMLKKKIKDAQSKLKKEFEGVSWEDRHLIKTAHFTIHCNSTKEVADKYAKLMELLYDKYSSIFKAFKPSDRICTINIHRNKTEFTQAYNVPISIGGFYTPGEYMLCTYHGMFGLTDDTTTILAHEGCHLFQDLIGMFGDIKKNRGQMNSPIWLIEGLAVVFEASEINMKREKVKLQGVNRDRLLILQREIENGKNLSIREIINMPKPKFTGRHYGYAGMFTYWLLFGATNKHRDFYGEYVKLATGWEDTPGKIIKSGDFDELLIKYVGKTLSDIEPEWQDWVKKQKIEKLGSMRSNRYVSKEMGFEVKRYDFSWSVDTDKNLEGSEQVVFTNNKTGGRIGINAEVNFTCITIELLRDNVKKNIEMMLANKTLKDFKSIENKSYYIKGHEVYDMIVQWKPSSETEDYPIEIKRTVFFVMLDNLYYLTLRCPPDKYEDNKEAFEKTLNSFKIYLDE